MHSNPVAMAEHFATPVPGGSETYQLIYIVSPAGYLEKRGLAYMSRGSLGFEHSADPRWIAGNSDWLIEGSLSEIAGSIGYDAAWLEERISSDGMLIHVLGGQGYVVRRKPQ